jgi:hypothetical protein
MGRLIDNVTALSALTGAIDGVQAPPRPRVQAERSPAAAIAAGWRCPSCGFQSDSVEDRLRHMTEEYADAMALINRVRDLLGREVPDLEDVVPPLTEGSLPGGWITAADAARELDVTPRQARGLASEWAKTGGARRVGRRSWVIDPEVVREYGRARYLKLPGVRELVPDA